MNKIFKIASVIIVALFTSYCKDPQSNDELNDNQSANRALLLSHIVNEIVVPSYANFKVKLDSLDKKVDKFSNTSNEKNLVLLREAWLDAYTEWQKIELLNFGPANQNAIVNYFNIYPTNVNLINTNILTPNINLDFASNHNSQGFPALDFLINGLASTDSDIVNFYTSTSDPVAPKRLAYLKKLSTQMQNKFNETSSAWNNIYIKSYIENTNLNGSTTDLVNGFIFSYESYFRKGKIGVPAGAMTNVPSPNSVEGFYKKDISKKLAQTAHQAYIDFFNGKSIKTGINGFSLKSYLEGIGAKDSKTGKPLTETLTEQFNVINNQLNGLDNNFFNIATNDNQKLLATYDEIQKALRMLKVDMSSAMSVLINYADTDTD